MFFVVLKGHLGKEIFLVDIEGLQAIKVAFESKDTDYEFYARNVKDLEEQKFICRKHQSVIGMDIYPENTPKEAMT